MNRPGIWLAVMAAALIGIFGCESREHSIERANGYIVEHPPEAVSEYFDEVPYAEVAGRELTLDVSVPSGEGPFPVLMVIHGGGWTLHTNTIMEGMSRYVTNRGYVVFNINYRVLVEGASLKEIVEDCIGALIWVKEHASEYKGDPSRVAVTGDSAGGHLTAMLVTQSDNPAFTPSYRGKGTTDRSITCAAPSYGVFNFVSLAKVVPAAGKHYLGASYGKDPELYELLSPIYHVRSGLPPQLLMVGNQDPLLFQSREYARALEEAGSPVDLWIFKGQTHAFLDYYWQDNGQTGCDRLVEFLDKHMK